MAGLRSLYKEEPDLDSNFGYERPESFPRPDPAQ